MWLLVFLNEFERLEGHILPKSAFSLSTTESTEIQVLCVWFQELNLYFTYSTKDSFHEGLFVSYWISVFSFLSPNWTLAYGLFNPRPSLGANPAASTTSIHHFQIINVNIILIYFREDKQNSRQEQQKRPKIVGSAESAPKKTYSWSSLFQWLWPYCKVEWL